MVVEFFSRSTFSVQSNCYTYIVTRECYRSVAKCYLKPFYRSFIAVFIGCVRSRYFALCSPTICRRDRSSVRTRTFGEERVRQSARVRWRELCCDISRHVCTRAHL